MTESGEIQSRREVLEFAELMEMNLRANDYKSSWKDYTLQYLFSRLFDELAELSEQLLEPTSKILVCSDLKKIACGLDAGWFKLKPDFNLDAVLSEIADVANFLMMLVDVIKKHSGRN